MEYAVLNFGRWCWTSYWLTIPRAFYMATLQHLVWSHLLICTHLLDTCVHVHLIAQLCLTLCDRIDCSPLGSSVHGNSSGKNTGVGCQVLLQGIFQPRDRTQVSHIAGRFFTVWVTREALTGKVNTNGESVKVNPLSLCPCEGHSQIISYMTWV